MWPGPHQVHVATQDVDELGELVEPEAPQPLPQTRHTMGLVSGPVGHVRSGPVHRPELEELEPAATQTHPIVDEQHRAPGIEPDGQGDEAQERSHQNQPRQRDEQAQTATGGALQA